MTVWVRLLVIVTLIVLLAGVRFEMVLIGSVAALLVLAIRHRIAESAGRLPIRRKR